MMCCCDWYMSSENFSQIINVFIISRDNKHANTCAADNDLNGKFDIRVMVKRLLVSQGQMEATFKMFLCFCKLEGLWLSGVALGFFASFFVFLIGTPGWMSSDIVNGESFVNCLPPVFPFTRLCCLDSWETPLNRLPLLSVQQRHTVTYDHVYTYSAEQFGVHVACMCFIGRKQSSWWKFSKRNHKFQKRKAT